ncbi:MAG: hypothetical protein ABSB01_18870 [Streptosporangiaceae bacterium]
MTCRSSGSGGVRVLVDQAAQDGFSADLLSVDVGRGGAGSDRFLVWNQAHLRQILNQYETHHNQHRPHRFLYGAAPLKPLPEPVDLEQYCVRRQARVGGLINEYRLVA